MAAGREIATRTAGISSWQSTSVVARALRDAGVPRRRPLTEAAAGENGTGESSFFQYFPQFEPRQPARFQPTMPPGSGRPISRRGLGAAGDVGGNRDWRSAIPYSVPLPPGGAKGAGVGESRDPLSWPVGGAGAGRSEATLSRKRWKFIANRE